MKLGDKQVAEVRREFSAKRATIKELAYKYGVVRQTISRIIQRTRRAKLNERQS